MEIKSIVKEICESGGRRIDYIINFLKQNNINHKIDKYNYGTNIEIIKKGKNNNKEIVFFSHHDVYNNSIDGANDNTSSVAILLTLAKFLYFYKPYYTVNIVFNDYEELIGGIFSMKSSKEKVNTIISKIGSFQYLKKNIQKKKSLITFILELSGIGDSVYIANRSGNIESDKNLNIFLESIANNLNLKNLTFPISLSDLIAVDYFGIKGTVFGSIPYIEGKNYLNNIGKKEFSKEIYPHVWKKNHTSMDKYYSIQEKSLNMIYNFTVEIIKNIEKIDEIYV